MEENQELPSQENKGSTKTKKILNIVVDIVCGVILVLALIVAISTITSRAKGYDQYTEIFGRAYLAVQSESMEKDYATGEVKEDNFSKGDLIVIKTLNEEQAKKLKVGDIITFRTNRISDDNKYYLNSHRIVQIIGEEGDAHSYVTKGDNNATNDVGFVSLDEVVGVYQGKAGGIGHMFLFMGTTAGFFTFVFVPTLIIVLYAAVNLVIVIMKERKEQAVAAEEAKAIEREQIRAELLAEMNGGAPEQTAENAENGADNAEAAADNAGAEAAEKSSAVKAGSKKKKSK